MQMISGELVVSGVSEVDITVKPEASFPWRNLAVLMRNVLILTTLRIFFVWKLI